MDVLGSSLTPPVTGVAAEKEFYRLRQKFGKERRKVLQSQGRSGAGGNNTTYTSNWALYNDLMFLTDHIQPRQTTSNYKSTMPVQHKVLNAQTSHKLVTSQPVMFSPAYVSPTNSNNSSGLGDVFESLSDKEGYFENVEDDTPSVVDPKKSCSTTSATTKSTSLGNTFGSVMKTMASGIVPAKLTPRSDIGKKRKQDSTNEIDAVMLQSSKNVSSLASTLDNVFKGQIATATASQQLGLPGITPEVQNMMGSIALGFSKVPIKSHMDCLINVLSCINEFIDK